MNKRNFSKSSLPRWLNQKKGKEIKEKVAQAPRTHPESTLQIQCVRWFKYKYPQYDEDLFSIPNGSKLSGGTPQKRKIQGGRLKAEGLLPGASDLQLAVPKGVYHGMFIEMKSKDGTVSPEQKKFLKRRMDRGYYACICYSIDEFMKEIKDYLSLEP